MLSSFPPSHVKGAFFQLFINFCCSLIFFVVFWKVFSLKITSKISKIALHQEQVHTEKKLTRSDCFLWMAIEDEFSRSNVDSFSRNSRFCRLWIPWSCYIKVKIRASFHRQGITHRRTDRGARGAAAPPPNFGQLRFFGQQEKIWAKPVFKDVFMFI